MKTNEVRVRIAPSPTGKLHFGVTRTALFNWLFAKKNNGTFVLRIEDTDTERSKKEFEEDILTSLKWMGIDWDEGPFRQSERTELYAKHLNKLLENNNAYYCFCTKEVLDEEREGMLASGLAPKYSGKCRSITKEEAEKRNKEGEKSVIRFKIPNETVTFADIIRGEISFDMSLVGDIVIAKNNSRPLYNFSVVVDDADMNISHVIRGEDHIANTPKQIILGRVLEFPEVTYAHIPLILDADRSKMSKRENGSAIADYKKKGYLADALINFIAFLGWHPKDDREILTRDELIEEFSLERVQKGGAAFHKEKLDWMNAQYIKQMKNADLLAELRNLDQFPNTFPEEKLLKIIELTKPRLHTLMEFNEESHFFYELPEYTANLLIWKETAKETIIENLTTVKEKLDTLSEDSFNEEYLQNAIMPLTESAGRGEVLWPFRVAMSGLKASPGPFEIASILGKIESLRRIDIALTRLTISNHG